MRVFAAFVIAPVVPALFAWLALSLDLFQASPLGQMLVIVAFSPVVAVPATWLVGLPLFLWFRQRRWLRFSHILIGGAIVALVATLAFAVGSLLNTANWYYRTDERLYIHWSSLQEGLLYALLFVPFGVSTACAFFVIAFWRAPNPSVRFMHGLS